MSSSQFRLSVDSDMWFECQRDDYQEKEWPGLRKLNDQSCGPLRVPCPVSPKLVWLRLISRATGMRDSNGNEMRR